MVSVHLELSDEAHARLLAEAEERGMSLSRYVTHTLMQRPGAPHYAGLLDRQLEAVDDSKDPLDAIQEAYLQCVGLLHHDMVSLQTELIGLQLDVVQRSLRRVQEAGLTAEHYFYVAFRTDDPDVLLGEDLRAQHPETMTIVLEHQFSQLEVDDNGFSVSLWFGGVPRRIGIPFSALVAFVDPSSELQLTFPDLRPRQAPAAPPAAVPAAEPMPERQETQDAPSVQPDEASGNGTPSSDSNEAHTEQDAAAETDGGQPEVEDEAAPTAEEESTGNVLAFPAFRKPSSST